MLHPALNRGEDLAGIAFEPAAVEGLCDNAKLHDEVTGEILGLSFAALLAPEAKQCGLVIAQDGPSVRAADEAAPFR